MTLLKSYIAGRWQAGTDRSEILVNPATEEPLGECRSGGWNAIEALEHARRRGGPALAALGWRGRAALLGKLAAALHAEREALLDLSMANGGNTRGDAKFDVDGAISTLSYYAKLGEALPEGNHLPDGEGVQLGRTPRFWGQHVLVPRLGAAVHINAFNFPAWGMFEKGACALLAGMPVIEKPGTPTALLAFRMAEIAVASGVLPEGSFQFIAGSAQDLLDRMGPQDCLAFTGSSGTGLVLRSNQNLLRQAVRVNVEADSLNAAVLGPDCEASSETYGMFLANVVQDMTQKTGQKCTAVRRLFVPRERVEEVLKDLGDALARVKTGNPLESGVTMGPLSSKKQLEEVRQGITALAAHARLVCGSAAAVHPKGFFVAPTLFAARDADLDLAHQLEVFGPCATVLPYEASKGAEEVVRLVARGGGCLTSSLYSNDNAWTTSVALGLVPWVGRLWLGSERTAGQALAPGMALGQLVHGGPGRAGGGEELGGLRGLNLYLQRAALQGFQGLVAASFGPPALKS